MLGEVPLDQLRQRQGPPIPLNCRSPSSVRPRACPRVLLTRKASTLDRAWLESRPPVLYRYAQSVSPAAPFDSNLNT